MRHAAMRHRANSTPGPRRTSPFPLPLLQNPISVLHLDAVDNIQIEVEEHIISLSATGYCLTTI